MASKVVVALMLCLAVAGVSSTRVLSGAGPTPGKFYLQARSSDTVTQLGQHPKIVLQLGNIGGTDITDGSIQCFYANGQDAQAVVFLSEILYWQKLIPGQNQNAEREYLAEALGTTYRYCEVYGKTLVNGVPTDISARSNSVDVKVVPQQG